MSIGSTIKRLRREKDITQEQLAEYLGITSRAISQWECDRTAPDISQLPALCHIFDVSSDVLLEIDVEKINEEIKKYLDAARDFCHRGKWEDYTSILREANKKFPRDYKIMQTLADAIVNGKNLRIGGGRYRICGGSAQRTQGTRKDQRRYSPYSSRYHRALKPSQNGKSRRTQSATPRGRNTYCSCDLRNN